MSEVFFLSSLPSPPSLPPFLPFPTNHTPRNHNIHHANPPNPAPHLELEASVVGGLGGGERAEGLLQVQVQRPHAGRPVHALLSWVVGRGSWFVC